MPKPVPPPPRWRGRRWPNEQPPRIFERPESPFVGRLTPKFSCEHIKQERAQRAFNNVLVSCNVR